MHPLLTLFAPPELRQGYLERQKTLESLLNAASELQALLDCDELDQATIKAVELGELGITFGARLDADHGQAPHLVGMGNNKHELEARTFAQRLLNHHDDNIRLSMPETISTLKLWARQALRAWTTARHLNSYRMRALAVYLVGIVLVAGIYFAVDSAVSLHFKKIELERQSQFTVDLASPGHILPPHFKVGGLLPPERDGALHWCWGLGPKTLIAFVLHKPLEVTVSCTIHNPIAGQTVTFNGNGALQSFTIEHPAPWPQANSELTFTFKGVQGLNTLSIAYADWNYKSIVFAPDDPNQYAVAFKRLELTTHKLTPNAGK
ncbi:hypothetical protein [Fundidesulfovibrio putealis]|uniref:hypothetical protein n=1 Tax=Fundidesulfovibrio putealis TaxID=270496 RepID=UPI00048158B4|nr:hypothetical protein [Fundidesulfovibrio putealis]